MILDEPLLDQPQVYNKTTYLSEIQKIWIQNGVVVLEGLVPHDAIDRYIPGKSYLESKELRDIVLNTHVMQVLECLIGEPMGLYSNSLPIENRNGWDASTFIALSDIPLKEKSFIFYPGSHRDGPKEQMNFTAKKGDVLFYHARLICENRAPKELGILSHYSSIYRRPDLGSKGRWKDSWYFIA